MPRSTSTRQLVRDAASRLLATGRGGEISTRKIRELIQVGSMGTVADELNAWWKDQSRPDAVVMPTLPPEIADAFTNLWAQACRAAAAQFDDERDTLVGQAVGAESALAETKALLQESEGRTAAANEVIARLTSSLESRQLELAKAREELAARSAQLEESRARTEAALKDAELTRKELAAHIAALREEADRRQEQFAAIERRMMTDIDRARTDLKTAQSVMSKLQHDMTAQEKAYIKEASTRREESKTLNRDLAAAVAREKQASTERDALREELGRIRNALAAAESLAHDRAQRFTQIETSIRALRRLTTTAVTVIEGVMAGGKITAKQRDSLKSLLSVVENL